jgi:hypothetical protein
MNRYINLPIFTNDSGKRYKAGARYPFIPYKNSDFYLICQKGDRYDLYANEYYNDPSLWWIIIAANPRFETNSIYPPQGEQIRIPSEISDIILEYNIINQ